ncbi:putative cytochrome P450 12a5, mitochondrial [Frankliniella fusca]|uniref:Cytochrome P450 12a5, mitochondrial n=1 Tax=Frankliniella fusca TaxID=407009 RepID=A0AAE1HTE9_9NEOP|nr:putative cytochrome P450 12a5, mitochondrial [Frankliniella fusca]
MTSSIRQTLCRVPVRFRSATAGPATTLDIDVDHWDRSKSYAEIPGPKPLPIVGNSWRFIPGIGEYANIQLHELFKAMKEKYGPICKLAGMPGRPDMLIVYDANSAQKLRALQNRRDQIGVTLTLSVTPKRRSEGGRQGKEWQEFRSSVNQVMMQPRNMFHYIGPVDQVSQEFIERMKSIRLANGQMPPNFSTELGCWTMESVCFLALDTRIGLFNNSTPPADATTMFNAVKGVFDGMYDLDIKPSLWKIAYKYVNKAMERLKNMPKEDLHEQQRSVLENLLLQTDDPNKAVAMSMDMLMAGVDTTAAVMSTILYQLANNPKKQERLQQELDEVIPDKSKPISKEQLEKLKYLRACIKETMRVMPIIAANFRDTGNDVVLGGYQVPKGTVTAMPTNELFMDEEYFPRAKEFLPERWLSDNKELKTNHPFAYVPFGFGPRMCVGKRFASLELELLTAKIFRNFSLEWHHPPAKTEFYIVLKFITPLQFTN